MNSSKWERYQQLKTILYKYRVLCKDVMRTANLKRKKSNTNTTAKMVIKPIENKRRREEKKPTNTNTKQLRNWQ